MGQLGWYYCGLCSTMNWLGDPPLHPRPGKCVANMDPPGKHKIVSFEFDLPVFDPTPGAVNGQKNWFFCVKCAEMFWAGNGDALGNDLPQLAGVCPAGGKHDRGDKFSAPASFNFALPHPNVDGLPVETPGTQQGWGFCGKCNALVFFGTWVSCGVCPVVSPPPIGSEHSITGAEFNFVLPHNANFLNEFPPS